MLTAALEKDEKRIVLQAMNFAQNINRFTTVLGLNVEEVTDFKNDVEIFLHLSKSYQSFTPGFIGYSLACLHRRFLNLIDSCANSGNYTKTIGRELGIEKPRFNFMQKYIPFY